MEDFPISLVRQNPKVVLIDLDYFACGGEDYGSMFQGDLNWARWTKVDGHWVKWPPTWSGFWGEEKKSEPAPYLDIVY